MAKASKDQFTITSYKLELNQKEFDLVRVLVGITQNGNDRTRTAISDRADALAAVMDRASGNSPGTWGLHVREIDIDGDGDSYLTFDSLESTDV